MKFLKEYSSDPADMQLGDALLHQHPATNLTPARK